MFMHRIKLENILSFGPDAQDLALKPLNVLIGPNGAGKSNLIEVIGLLKAATNDITTPMREGGGERKLDVAWRTDRSSGREWRFPSDHSLSWFEKRLVRYSHCLRFLVIFGSTVPQRGNRRCCR